MVYRTWTLPLVLCGLVFTGLASKVDAAIQVLDLTTANASATATAALGGSFFVQQVPGDGSTGTGLINSFLRLQDKGNEQGYNNSTYQNQNDLTLDQKAGSFTRAIHVSDLPLVNLLGTDYRRFLLDINQIASSPNHPTGLLTLNQVQIFLSNTDVGNVRNVDYTLTDPTALLPPQIAFPGATETFRINNSSNANFTQTLLNYDLNSGSGKGDMYLYVRNSNFGTGDKYVVLFSQFGVPPGGSATNDGFEEWAPGGAGSPANREGGDPVVPEPASLAIWGLGAGLALVVARFRRKTAA